MNNEAAKKTIRYMLTYLVCFVIATVILVSPFYLLIQFVHIGVGILYVAVIFAFLLFIHARETYKEFNQ